MKIKKRNNQFLRLGIFILMLRIQQVASLGIFVSIYPVHLPDEDKNLLTFANEEEIEIVLVGEGISESIPNSVFNDQEITLRVNNAD